MVAIGPSIGFVALLVAIAFDMPRLAVVATIAFIAECAMIVFFHPLIGAG